LATIVGMSVRLTGRIGDDVIERNGCSSAEHGDGPEIPTLAAVLLAEALLAGTVPVGARDAGRLLDLDDFAPAVRLAFGATANRERR